MTDVIKDSNLKRERERVSQAREGRQKVSSTIHRQSFIHTIQYLPEADENDHSMPLLGARIFLHGLRAAQQPHGECHVLAWPCWRAAKRRPQTRV